MNKIYLFLMAWSVLFVSGCKISLAWNGFSFGVDKTATVYKDGSYVTDRDFIGLDLKYAPDMTIDEMVGCAASLFDSSSTTQGK